MRFMYQNQSLVFYGSVSNTGLGNHENQALCDIQAFLHSLAAMCTILNIQKAFPSHLMPHI